MRFRLICAVLAIMLGTIPVHAGKRTIHTRDLRLFEWTLENEAAQWEARAGLQAVELDDQIYLLGGRTPINPMEVPVPGASVIHGDVWRSGDLGRTWEEILDTADWPARAYFQALTKNDQIYVIGGQDFTVIDNPDPSGPPQIAVSNFFSDVWSSGDGINWTQRTGDAGWEGRAGLSAVVFNDEIYVLGGSVNDDESIGGPGGPARIYFNDVWKSSDGEIWVQVTDDAPWEARAGAIAVSYLGYIYLIGGEAGFLCEPFPGCDPPYFNDVWRSRDGANWELMTAEAAWSARPGHQAVVALKQLVLFGGFGISDDPTNPFAANNPMDVWVSLDGADWEQVSDSPWNASTPEEIKYDFDALVVQRGPNGVGPAILSFGGDRETFDFTDFTNYLNVDNDVWSFTLPARYLWGNSLETNQADAARATTSVAVQVTPNPFNPVTTISFANPSSQSVRLDLYDLSGRRIRTLVDQILPAGEQSLQWDGTDERSSRVASGVYLYRLQAGDQVLSGQLLLAK